MAKKNGDAAVTSDNPAVEGDSRQEFLKALADIGLDGLGTDVGLDAGRYSPDKCGKELVVGYLYKKDFLQGGANGDGWTGYFIRLARPVTALFGKDGKETKRTLEAGRDLILPPSHKIVPEFDRILESGKDGTVRLIALMPDEKVHTAKNRDMWNFHIKEFTAADVAKAGPNAPKLIATREELALPAWEDDGEGNHQFGANTDEALKALAAAAS